MAGTPTLPHTFIHWHLQDEKYVVGGGQPNYNTPVPDPRPTTAKDLLQQKLTSLQPTRKLVKANTSDGVLDGFRLLIENKLLSIPLYSIEKQRYVGFMDIVDVLHHFLDTLDETEVLAGFESFQNKLSSVTCGDVSDLSGHNPYKAIDSSAPLQSAIHLICTWKVHRVPLVDINGNLQHVFSQSYLVKYLAKFIQLFPFVSQTVSDLKLGYKYKVIPVTATSLVKDAFNVMRDNKISGVGVVDDSNNLVGALSTSDLRAIGYTEELFPKCYLRVSEFLRLIGQHLVMVHPSDTIGRVAQIFSTTDVHRIFVVVDNKPIGVISLYDFIQLFDSK